MASYLTRPAGMFAWHRWKLGWLDPTQIACLTRQRRIETTIRPLETAGGVKALIFKTAHSALVAEVRQRTLEDGAICRQGVLIYRVLFSAPAGSADIHVIRARSGVVGDCGPQSAAPFDLGRGAVSRARVGNLLFELRRALPDGSYRVALTRLR
jgi:hypothetical protein